MYRFDDVTKNFIAYQMVPKIYFIKSSLLVDSDFLLPKRILSQKNLSGGYREKILNFKDVISILIGIAGNLR